ncbi:MAG: flagellar motor switch protein FliG [Nitrospirota bacterium]
MAKKLKGHEKAAILLLTIGEDAAAEVLKNLDVTDIRKLGNYMSNIPEVTSEDINDVLKEFTEASSSFSDIPLDGGDEYVKKILIKALGEEKAAKVIENFSLAKNDGLENLKLLDAKTIANFIRLEHPQTIALILVHLDPDHATEVISYLSKEIRADIIHRMATIETIPQGTIKELEEVLQEELKNIGSVAKKDIGGIKLVAEIINQMESSQGEEILSTLQKNNPDLVDDIRQLMFVFDDLEKIDDKGIQELLKEANKDDLMLALKATSDAIKEKIFKNMSQRAAELMKEDMEAKGPARISEVEKAQQSILKAARKLEEEGKIIIGGKGGEEMVV